MTRIIVAIAVVIVVVDVALVEGWMMQRFGCHQKISHNDDSNIRHQRPLLFPQDRISTHLLRLQLSVTTTNTVSNTTTTSPELILFNQFVEFLIQQQTSIIHDIETTIEASSGQTFTRDTWGIFQNTNNDTATTTATTGGGGGITRVLQHGGAIEKGACSLTVIRNGILSVERTSSILGRQPPPPTTTSNHDDNHSPPPTIQARDTYSAVALSMVLHSRNPMVPTFRSDVRMFQVHCSGDQNNKTNVVTWLGGGADLTPYYLFRNDIQTFHQIYHDLCRKYTCSSNSDLLKYELMKQACDNYFYLPARQEHRGTGGIFFDDIPVRMMDHVSTASTTAEDNPALAIHPVLEFGQEMTQSWMKSWIPIVKRRNHMAYTSQEKHWQKLRRGRYLEFNLLYDVSWIVRLMLYESFAVP